jgi:alpha-L-rhamnosidase
MHGTIKSKWELKEDHTLYSISIPANTTATVYLKANSINDIRESGKKLKKSTTIELLDRDSERISFKIRSGNYSFKVISNN